MAANKWIWDPTVNARINQNLIVRDTGWVSIAF